ncbi:slipin family protein [Streptomyces sp. NPDC060184]|uniref:slipin family protein n=1 Tax=Streptomyces sp. NPDC060184 TaxID=3347064 RepID=UPI003648D081
MVQVLVIAIVGLLAVCGLFAVAGVRVVRQYERGVVLRLGRLRNEIRGPGLTMIVPGVDRLRKVNLQIVTMPVPAQDGITRDNVTVRVDAVIYFKVIDAASAVIQVEDYRFAVSQMAQTSLRSIIGKSDLDDLLSNREKLNEGLELMIDSPAVGWGVQIDRVEIKDVSLPETMKRSMARQAEADRERRARVINADAELQASKKLAEAAGQMSAQPAALQLRLLQTVVAVAAEKNSTLVLPFPVELLRFLERAQQPQAGDGQPRSATSGTQSSAPVASSAQPAAPTGPPASGAQPTAGRAPAAAANGRQPVPARGPGAGTQQAPGARPRPSPPPRSAARPRPAPPADAGAQPRPDRLTRH